MCCLLHFLVERPRLIRILCISALRVAIPHRFVPTFAIAVIEFKICARTKPCLTSQKLPEGSKRFPEDSWKVLEGPRSFARFTETSRNMCRVMAASNNSPSHLLPLLTVVRKRCVFRARPATHDWSSCWDAARRKGRPFLSTSLWRGGISVRLYSAVSACFRVFYRGGRGGFWSVFYHN